MSSIETSPDIKDIASALLVFQAEVGGVLKDGRNPAFRSRYATLENVIDTVRPGLQSAGIVFLQAPGMIVDGKMCLTTRLIHSASGQWIQSTMQAPLPKNDPQAVGSATTYLSRYSLMAILGVPPTDDDDAERAMPDRGSGSQGRPTGNGRVEVTSGTKPAEPSSSHLMADGMIAALKKRAGPAAIEAFLAHPDVKRDLAVMEIDDHTRVMGVAAERKAIAPAAQTERAA